MLESVKEYGTELWIIWGAVITICSVIVKITPNKKDDKIFDFVFKIINALALNPNEEARKKKEEEAQQKALDKLEGELDEKDSDVTRDNLIDSLK